MNIEDKLLFLSKNIQDVILLVEDDKVVYYTESYKKMFNNKLDSISNIKGDLSKFICTEFKEILENYRYDEEFNNIFKINTGDNDFKWISMKSTPAIEKNNTSSAIITLSDMTDKIHYEINQKQSRLEFFSNIIHEFKTPLNLIFSSIQLLNKEMDTKGSYKQDFLKRYLNIINQNTYRILKLVNNISDDTKIDSGHHTYNPTNGNIVCFIESICQSIVTLAKLNNMNIVFDTEIEELTIGFDIEKMEKIILNLLSNSIKFRKENNGKILVTISCDSKFVNIKIRDNGIGIKKENISNIFGKYIRVNDDKSLVKEGSGIGLSLVEDFVKLHLGSVSVDSLYGSWTEFSIMIPNKTVREDTCTVYNLEDDRIERIKVEFSDIYKVVE